MYTTKDFAPKKVAWSFREIHECDGNEICTFDVDQLVDRYSEIGVAAREGWGMTENETPLKCPIEPLFNDELGRCCETYAAIRI